MNLLSFRFAFYGALIGWYVASYAGEIDLSLGVGHEWKLDSLYSVCCGESRSVAM